MFEGSQGSVDAGLKSLGESFPVEKEFVVVDGEVGCFVGIGGGDTAAGGAAFLMTEDVDPVPFPAEVEEPVGKVAHHGPLINEESGFDRIPVSFDVGAFPDKFVWIGDNATGDGEAVDLFLNNAGREEIELETAAGVSGVGSPVDLDDHADGAWIVGLGDEFVDQFGNEAALALIAHADSGIKENTARKRCQCHLSKRVNGKVR